MPVEEVARQIELVALAVKAGSSISDMRHHTFTGKLKGAQVRQLPHASWTGLAAAGPPGYLPAVVILRCLISGDFGPDSPCQLAAVSSVG